MERNVYIILGSNLGDKRGFIEKASKRIDHEIGSIVKFSAFYQTSPWGFDTSAGSLTDSVGEFLNRVICVKSEMEANTIMRTLLEIETELGRNRHGDGEGYLSRTIDLDILLIDDLVINNDLLIVPHPRMTMRNFVLYPLAEIAGNIIHPTERKSINELLKDCKDQESVIKVL
ncbi:MAG: 2-amino-4-hydroxy-6-hydroxymethyldihydropteridine diphosphokinase [Bacteroidota bacterium]